MSNKNEGSRLLPSDRIKQHQTFSSNTQAGIVVTNRRSQRINILLSPDRIVLLSQVRIKISRFNTILLQSRKERATANIQSLQSLLSSQQFLTFLTHIQNPLAVFYRLTFNVSSRIICTDRLIYSNVYSHCTRWDKKSKRFQCIYGSEAM